MNRVHTPTIIQLEALECGAAALGIVLGYHGCFVPLEELRHECGVSRDGSKASNMLKAARKYGLEGKGFRITEVDCMELFNQQLPVILFWDNSHFLVLEGRRGRKIYLNDPAFGPRTVDIEEFNRLFSGVYLSFSKTEDFHKSRKPATVFMGLFSRLKGADSSLFFAFAVSLSLILPGLAVPSLSKIFVDQYLLEGENDFAHPILAILSLFLIASVIMHWLQKTVLIKLETKLNLSSSYNFMWHILRLPLVFFSQRSSGDVVSRLQSNNEIANLLSGQLAATLFNMIQILFLGIFMLLFSWKLTLIVFLFAFINIIVYHATKKLKRDIGFRLQEAKTKLTGTSMWGNYMIEAMKASGAESDFYARWAGFHAKFINARQQQAWVNILTDAVPTLCTGLSTALVLGGASLLIIQGELTIGDLLAFVMLATQFNAPINGLVQFGSSLQQISVEIKRLDDVLDYDVDKKYTRPEAIAPELLNHKKLTGKLELKNITFGYSSMEAPIIENFNLTLTPGSRVALVGPSGSGKSTIAKLIAGLYSPWEGEILFDGVPLEQIPVSIMAVSLAVVEQNPFFFKGSVRENITMWDSSIHEDEITLAAKRAEIYEEVARRLGAFECEMHEAGTNFSGGQLQRLEITRALLSDPSILVMDEGTSSLDPILEGKIYNNIRSLGITSLIIAHRLSAIRDCETILVIEKGKVVESGTHEELIKNNASYMRFINSEQ